jgi:tetratricopeptide (TPR) repeat protein
MRNLLIAAILVVVFIKFGLLSKLISDLNHCVALVFITQHDYKNAIKCLDQAISEGRENSHVDPQYYAERAYSYEKLGNYREAVNDLSQSINNHGKNKFPFRTANWYALRADAYRMLGEYQKAINDYSEALNVDQKNGSVYFTRGLAYDKLGKLSLAASDMDKAKELGYSPKYGVE